MSSFLAVESLEEEGEALVQEEVYPLDVTLPFFPISSLNIRIAVMVRSLE